MNEEIPRLDKSALSVVSLYDPDPDREFWLSKSPLERLEAVELCRRMVYGEDCATSRLQRVLEVAKLERG